MANERNEIVAMAIITAGDINVIAVLVIISSSIIPITISALSLAISTAEIMVGSVGPRLNFL